jgi:hypothetical protein
MNIGAELGIDHRGQQGIIPIKRAGTSQNTNITARRRAGWCERRTLNELRDILNPSPTATPALRPYKDHTGLLQAWGTNFSGIVRSAAPDRSGKPHGLCRI